MRYEVQYRKLIKEIAKEGHLKENRTGVKTLCLFNKSLTINIRDSFPILTAKKIFFEKALAEYNWMILGLRTTNYLHENNIRWWDEYADSKGDLRITYGTSLRNFNNETDQLDYIHKEIRNNSRRAHVSLWEANRLEEALLPPCLTGFTFMRINNSLNMSLQIRSSDVFLGLPYDIILAALFLIDVAKFNELTPNEIGVQITDAHLYTNHNEAVKKYLNNPIKYPEPILYIHPETKEKSLVRYKSLPFIEAKMNN